MKTDCESDGLLQTTQYDNSVCEGVLPPCAAPDVFVHGLHPRPGHLPLPRPRHHRRPTRPASDIRRGRAQLDNLGVGGGS